MDFVEVITPTRTAMVNLRLKYFGRDISQAFQGTDVSGEDVWAAISENNFSNIFTEEDATYLGNSSVTTEIFRDCVEAGDGGNDNRGRLHIIYISHADTEMERGHPLWAPPSGIAVPTSSGLFHEGTPVPFETVRDVDDAIKRFPPGFPICYLPRFERRERYDNERAVVGRDINTRKDVYAHRFDISAYWSTHGHRYARTFASRPVYEANRIVMQAGQLRRAG